ncbi:Fet3 protein [Armillaria novae-zelandiae]|uniref:Fet3 protein n=1 Tax=Armillaria novae-zelandiae TaxID=153914 RepID=A0AA39NVS0_9AGAR|nr:Fet3 protein [Armillaria novae-zelandiae]
MHYFLCFVIALLASPVFAGIQEVWWNITYVHGANPDGRYPRRVVGVNGTWPPPPIDVEPTDSLILHATNSLDRATTLHHHGMLFNSTPWMDGAYGLSECGIPPGGQFDYVVPINASGQSGTFWVHGHANGQYVDGLRAPAVIQPHQQVYAYDEEYTVILGDWYHKEHSVLMKEFLTSRNPDGAEPVPDSALIYFAQKSSYLRDKFGSVAFNKDATLPFQTGKTYRLRILNTSAFAMFMFWIDGHDMRLIEVDGTDIEESPINLISVSAGQRYSVLVTARNDTDLNWAVHSNMDTAMFDEIPDRLKPNVTASIGYSPLSPLVDLGTINAYTSIDDIALVPLKSVAAPDATKTIEVEVSFDAMTDGTNRGMFNQITYNPPLVPALFSELSLGSNASSESAYGPLSFMLEHMEVIDLVIKNGDDNMHPFHMHGHVPMMVGRAEDYTSSDPILNPPIVRGQLNPMRRDTFDVPAGGSLTLRIVADNPGAWIMHCHIEWHLEAGLAIQLIEAPLIAQERGMVIPQVMHDHCQALSRPSKGNAAGHNSTTDLSGWPLGPYPTKEARRCLRIGACVGLAAAALLSLATVVWRRRAWKKKARGVYEELPTFDSEDYRLDSEKKVRRRSRYSLPAS